MQKKTALRTRSHRKVSPIKESGLTAKAKKAKRSAGTASALDNRSHRTPSDSAARAYHTTRRSRAP